MLATGGDAVLARSSPIAASPQGTPYARQSVDRSPCAAQGLLGVSPHSGGPEVRLGKRRGGSVSHATGGVVGPGVTPISPFAGVLGASPTGVPAVRDAAVHGGVFGGPLLPSPLLPRRLDYAATIPSAPVWSLALAPPCPAGGASLSGDRSDAWRCPTVSCLGVVGAAAGSSAVPPQSPFVAPDSTPPVDDVDSSAAVGGTPYSDISSIVRVCVRDACRRRLYALRDAMAGVGDHRGLVSDVIDRLLHWSLAAIRAEFGVGVADVISSSLPSRVGMEYETRLVVGVHTLRPKIEGKASNALEVPAVVQLLRGLMEKGLKIRCVVSDDCVALGPQLRALNIDSQKDCHHKIKNIRKHFHSMLHLKEAKKVSNPHECVSETQFMQFTKKRLMEALEQRFRPGVLTPAEERMKKSDFVAVVMRKMYPYGSRSNARALETDPDGLTKYHAHEVGMWFLRACQLCRAEGGDASSLHRDIMLVADHWAGDHSGCVCGRESTIIIYAKKSVHFEKSYYARLLIAVIRWNDHYWRDPVGYVARIAAGTSIRPRPGFRRHYGEEAIDSWQDRLTASVFGSARVSDWARELLRQEVCPYGAAPLPRDLFVNGGGDPVEVVYDDASGSDHEAVGDNRVFIIGHVEDDVVPACDDWVPASSSESEGDNIELFSV
ncbi:hypothetical protein CBR_g45247 [Chara braunii]|uniref:Uncharacterized protein n=1 Tax=Chara braunii TaxID=69332 RepID=A0A388K3B5_CHABU|nr:hypothetical protein CBR_g45247 [Chara braunii]|eukprot:GBG64552.1 hypothetical protein CBR_g45247 [Chara braunii]